MSKHYNNIFGGWYACPICEQIIDFKEYKNGIPQMWTCETSDCPNRVGKHDIYECCYITLESED